MEPLTGSNLRIAIPAVRAGFKALRQELARRSNESGLRANLTDIDELLDEGLAVLAGEAATLLGAATVGVKGLVSRPTLFARGAPRNWIATELAQLSLKEAARAAVRGENEQPYLETATEHYRLIAEDESDDVAPDADIVCATALDFLLRTLRRELTVGDRLLLSQLQDVHAEIERLRPPDTSDLADSRVRDRLSRLRRARFFRSADTKGEAARLAQALVDGQLRGATIPVKAEALAWCVRVTAYLDEAAARDWLDVAETLNSGAGEALTVAKAFVRSLEDWRASLGLLDPEHSSVQATAAFQILRRGLEPEGALAHAEKAGLGFDILDGDGRYSLITALIEVGRWEEALASTRRLSAEDFEATPALLWVTASVLVASRLPEDLRRPVLQDIPSNPATFPLGEDAASIDQRRLASELMDQVAAGCASLDLPREAEAAERYSLWLALRDPSTHTKAREALRARMKGAGGDLAYVPLALSFGLEVNRDELEIAIERRLALAPDPAPNTVMAMTALLIDYALRDPVRATRHLERYRPVFSDYLDVKSLLALEVKILTGAGRAEEARRRLESASPEALAEVDRALLESVIDAPDAEPAVEALEEAYRIDPNSARLVGLVRQHGDVGVTPRYLQLSRKLLTEMPTTVFAEDVITTLIKAGHDAEAADLIALLDPDLVGRSDTLLTHAAWLEYRLGRLQHSDQLLQKLEQRRDSQDDRSLRYHLLVASGQWEALDAFLDRQWQRRAERSPIELAQFGTLAAQIGAKRVAEFLQAAVAAAPKDPHVLVAAYSAAVSAGIEDSIPGAGLWIMRAAEHSGEDGPVQSRSIQDLLQDRPEWDERVEDASRALAAGSAPLDTIAGAVRRPWLDLHLAPLVTNPSEPDVRQHRLIVPFSGRPRVDRVSSPDLARVALDPLALVTLATVDVLDVLELFDTVILSHDTLSELFEQRNRLSFHQPSRIAFAHKLTELLSRGQVHALPSTSAPDLSLVNEIGNSLASLLSEATAADGGQAILVHSYPITRVGSLLSEAVDLSAYQAHLCSCTAVIEALEQMGRVTQAEARAAKAYLDRAEKRWPDEPRVEPGAALYLSDLAVSYFRHTGLLDRIATAGFRVTVSRSELELAHALRDSETLSQQVDEILGRLRRSVTAGMDTGRIVLDALPREESPAEIQVETLKGLVTRSSALVSDDRFLNKYSQFDYEGGSRRILSSIELLHQLSSIGRFDQERLGEIRTRLRRAGAAFVPVTGTELIEEISRANMALANGAVASDHGGFLLETAELRAIRENIRLVQARGWFDPQSDNDWLMKLHATLADALVAQWTAEIPDDLARARANWLMRLMDSRDWGESVVRPDLHALGEHGIVLDINRLASLHSDVSEDYADRYSAWLQEEVVEPLWYRQPKIREVLLNHLRGFIVAMSQELNVDEGVDTRVVARIAFERFPKFLQLAMLEDEGFQDRVGFTLDAQVGVGPASFARSHLIEKVQALYAAPTVPLEIVDEAETTWTLSTDIGDPLWALRLRRGKVGLRTRGLLGLHEDPAQRVAMLDALLAHEHVALPEFANWRETLLARTLEASDMEELDLNFSDLPPIVENMIVESMEANEATISLLVPATKRYWERLIGKSDAETLTEWLEKPGEIHAWSAGDALTRARWALLLSAHPALLRGTMPQLSQDEWKVLGKWVSEHGDVMSKIGFVELALRHVHADLELEQTVLTLAAIIEGLDPDDEGGPLHLFSSTVILVAGELSRNTALADWPVWRRRLAAFAQAGLIARLLAGERDTTNFSRFCADQRGWRFMVQTLCDLRSEPRWRPEFIAPDQLRHELIGRLVNSATALEPTEHTEGIEAKLLAKSDSVRARMAIPMVFWPGPLEGGLDVDLQFAPDEFSEAVSAALEAEPLTLEALTLLLNVQATYRLRSDLIESAVARIAQAGPQLLASVPSERAQNYLLGLAHLAATYRLPALADSVRTLARHNRARRSWAAAEEMQLVLFAAAAREDEHAWREFVGQWCIELASQKDIQGQAEQLLGWIDTLCEIDAPLRSRTGRARALVRLVTQG